MIAHLRGTLAHKTATHVIIDVQGVGYGLAVPLSTFYRLPETGQSVSLNVHTHVKEDAIQLFGFLTPQEKEVFQIMISVSGIGPRLALNILSGISAEDLGQAISTQNFAKLTGIPGVGRKTAERIVFELRDKIIDILGKVSAPPAEHEPVTNDALSALLNLGYRRAVAKNAVDAVMRELGETPSLEVVLTEALKKLSN